MKAVEPVLVATLFVIFLGLWKIKQLKQKKKTGINPNVMASSTSSIQKYMNQLIHILSVYAVIIIVLHSVNLQIGSLFRRIDSINFLLFDIIGFVIGLIGLSFCLHAQIKMGISWRVGIDEKVKTDLVTTGLYKYIRNPTYLGLFILNMGVWLIWPTWTIFLMNIIFVVVLDIQVRYEEDYLLLIHGIKYKDYKESTKRYIPYLY